LTGESSPPIIINAAVTFSITVVPLIIANIVSIESRPQGFNRAVRHILFPGVTANLFFLFLFSLYRQQSIAESFLHLCEKINVKFLVVALFVDLLIIGTLKYVTGSVKIHKTHAPKPILALSFTSLFLIDRLWQEKTE
jgi:hypothetical protein